MTIYLTSQIPEKYSTAMCWGLPCSHFTWSRQPVEQKMTFEQQLQATPASTDNITSLQFAENGKSCIVFITMSCLQLPA